MNSMVIYKARVCFDILHLFTYFMLIDYVPLFMIYSTKKQLFDVDFLDHD